jgi:hypothetical protein
MALPSGNSLCELDFRLAGAAERHRLPGAKTEFASR